MGTFSTLKLVCERKICELVSCDKPTKRWEASGVLVKDGHYFVVFDDRTAIARISDDLEPNHSNALFGTAHHIGGYEGITYNAAKVNNGRMAIVSQVNSMLWVGQFGEADWTCRDEGQLYEFPRFNDGCIQYGNIEGVGWITPTRIVAVSDKRKKAAQPEKALSEKDQSVHIFDIPT
jgi:hypothetical protein